MVSTGPGAAALGPRGPYCLFKSCHLGWEGAACLMMMLITIIIVIDDDIITS